MWDFVVVGAGPAGSRFARQAALAGHDVLVLERTTVGRPLACSGHVSRDIWAYTGDVRAQLLQHEIDTARFHVTRGPGNGYQFYADAPISQVIDRVGLDTHLAARARAAGATIREQHTVIDVSPDTTGVTVTARTPDGTTTYRGKMVAGADGPHSRVRSALGLEEPRRLFHGVFGHHDQQSTETAVDVNLTVPGLFAWRIPRGEAGIEYGVAVPPGTNAKAHFRAHLSAYDVDPTQVQTRSGVIPVGPPPETVGNRGFLLGDAAAQTKPFTGGGILYGLSAADHAAATIKPWNPDSLAAYEQAWRTDLGREIQIGRWLRYAYDLPTSLQRIGLALTAGELNVHMDRPTTLLPGR